MICPDMAMFKPFDTGMSLSHLEVPDYINFNILWILSTYELSGIELTLLSVNLTMVVTYRHLTDIWSHYYRVNIPGFITQNSFFNNISTTIILNLKQNNIYYGVLT